MPVDVLGQLWRGGAWLVVLVAAGSILFNALAYLGATIHRRRHPPACPAGDDDEDASPLARALVAARAFAVESAVTALLVLTFPFSLRRLRVRPFDDRVHRRPVVFLHGYA